MTDLNPKLIFYIRQELNDIPEEFISDETILNSIQKAIQFVDKVVDPATDAAYKEMCIRALATYYTYVSYVSSVDSGLKGVPDFVQSKVDELKSIALSLIRLASPYSISDNFEVTFESIPVASFTTKGFL